MDEKTASAIGRRR